MNVDFNRILTTLDGESLDFEINTKDKHETVPLTLKTVCTNALLGVNKSDDNEDGSAKAARYMLALSINKGGFQDMTAEEIVLIKKRIGSNYAPLVVGQAYLFLEGK